MTRCTTPRIRRAGHLCAILLVMAALTACHPSAVPDSAAPARAATTAADSPATSPQPPPFTVRDFVGDGTFGHGIEGPTAAPDGSLYVVGYGPDSAIARVATGPDGRGRASRFLKLPDGGTANALQYTRDGAIFAADYTGHRIYRINPANATTQVFARLDGAHQPNDIAFAPDGTLYASDPDWRHGTGRIWKITPQGKATVLESGMGTTNGIAVSPDGKRLYVNESVQRKVWVYDIRPDGTPVDKRLLMQFDSAGLDGMRTDIRGNLYIARYDAGRILMVSPEGKVLHRIELQGDKPTNLAFGGPDRRQVYVTLQDRGAIETFRAPYPGRPYPPSP